ncbi:MAG: Gfo/Idh/MocA family protein [Acidobacteriota bacterium]
MRPVRASAAHQETPPQVAPSDQIAVGFLGVGRMGLSNIRDFALQPEVRVEAVCDVYAPHLEKAEQDMKVKGYSDFREVLDRQDIDVIVISSPDHWHPLMAVMACQAGKDVYVEKPVSVAVVEGRQMVEAARKYDRVVQVGTQQRSGVHFKNAVQILRRGDIGEISAARTWMFGNAFPKGIGNPQDSEPPAGLDWDLWLGPAPKAAFNANRFGVGDRWSTFRYFWDYAGGMMTDWGVHLLDIVQWAMNVDGPISASAGGAKYMIRDNRQTPDTLSVTYEYPNFLCTFENRACNSSSISSRRYGIEFYGTNGTLVIDRQGFEITPEIERQGEREVARMHWMKEENRNNQHLDHVRNFIDCLKSRKQPVSDIETGHHSTTVCHLGNIAYRTGRKIVWDAKEEKIVGDAEAAKLLSYEYREPWKL